MKLWSPGRVKAYQVALQQETPTALAVLRIPRLDLEVPVYEARQTRCSTSPPAASITRPCPARRATSASRPTATASSEY